MVLRPRLRPLLPTLLLPHQLAAGAGGHISQYLQYPNISSSRAENTSCSPPPWPWPTSPGLYLSISTTRHVSTLSLSTPVSSFGKFSLTGPDSAQLLDVATAGAVPRPGRTVLCHMLTQGGKVTTLIPGQCFDPLPLPSAAAGLRRANGHLSGGGQLPHRYRRRQRAARPQAAARGI